MAVSSSPLALQRHDHALEVLDHDLVPKSLPVSRSASQLISTGTPAVRALRSQPNPVSLSCEQDLDQRPEVDDCSIIRVLMDVSSCLYILGHTLPTRLHQKPSTNYHLYSDVFFLKHNEEPRAHD